MNKVNCDIQYTTLLSFSSKLDGESDTTLVNVTNVGHSQVNAFLPPEFFEIEIETSSWKVPMASSSHRFTALEPALKLSGFKIFQEKLRFLHPTQFPPMKDAGDSALMLWGFVTDGRHRKEQKRWKQILKIIFSKIRYYFNLRNFVIEKIWKEIWRLNKSEISLIYLFRYELLANSHNNVLRETDPKDRMAVYVWKQFIVYNFHFRIFLQASNPMICQAFFQLIFSTSILLQTSRSWNFLWKRKLRKPLSNITYICRPGKKLQIKTC